MFIGGGKYIKVMKIGTKFLQVSPFENTKDIPQMLPGKYLGWEGDDRFGMVISDAKDGGFPITIYEDGLPGQGFNERDDDYYTGTATLAKDNSTLEILLDKKFDEGREQNVEPAIRKLTTNVKGRGKVMKNNAVLFDQTLEIAIPANRKWDAVKVEKQK